MTLTTSLQKRFVIALAMIALIGNGILSAKTPKKFTIEGRVLDENGDGVRKAEVELFFDGEPKLKKPVSTNKKGAFSLSWKKFKPGDYTIKATHEDDGTDELIITLTEDALEEKEWKKGKKDIGEMSLSTAAPEAPLADQGQTMESMGASTRSNAPMSAVKVPNLATAVPKTPAATGVPSKHFIVNELSFEIKRLSAEFKHLNQELNDLKALSKMWVNPLTMYSKEIILKNGSTVFGKIVYQDDKSLKVETLVGYLIVDRGQVVRIVDNVISEDRQEYIPEQIRDSYTPPPMPKLAQPKYTSTNNSSRNTPAKFSANCVLVGNIAEKKDTQGNVIFEGEIKNIGGRRADFVKVDFVFRKNWSGETKTLTTFAKGSYNTFESGIVSDASLLPGATGAFDLYVPQDFGTFIGYSYVIDWEEYQ